jgi:hypothetical protein
VLKKLNVDKVPGTLKVIDFISDAKHLGIVMEYGGMTL